MKTIQAHQEGICPNPECKAEIEDLEYQDYELEGDTLTYNIYCKKCKNYFKEHYDIIYSESRMKLPQ
jgi:hypothetical protein